MSINNAYQKYKENQVNLANQGQLILMLYDGAIKFVNKALECMDKKAIEQTHKNITKTKDIITELTTSLNMEAGEISQRLLSIYMYLNRRLSEANLSKQKAPLLEVKKHLSELREAWDKASKTADVKEKVGSGGGINIAT